MKCSFHLILTAVLQDVVLHEEVEPPPPPAAETVDDTVEECAEEGPDNYAEERTKVCLL